MNNIQKYSNQFFDKLEMFEDLSRGHSYKIFLRQAVFEFLENETKDTAFAIYQTFFDSYRIILAGESNPFIDLVDVLHSYEENAAVLIDKQRDHYIHSVNVFILGLCIYAQNSRFQAAFKQTNLNKKEYPYCYDTKNEEFFYRWGIASLFHDVGYPIEIIGKQITKFINFASEVDKAGKVKAHLEFDNFEDLNSISEVLPKGEFIKPYYEKHNNCDYLDLLKPNDLLAHKLHLSLGVDLKQIKIALDGFVSFMAQSGFIDHGYFSALIVLKWYGFLFQSCRYKSDYFFYPVLDSASAILLHNYYRNSLMKSPFRKGLLSPKEHPIAYLLILCDELQEWNREAYGILDKKRAQAGKATLVISDNHLVVTYAAKKGVLPEQFSTEKETFLNELLNLNELFSQGFNVNCEGENVLAELAVGKKEEYAIVPRPLLENLEKLAIAIHDLYNEKQLERHPNQPLEHPQFADLPDTLKYSNLRQARSIADKLELAGWEMRPQGSDGEVIKEIPEEIVEILARFEQHKWTRERLGSGWKYGKVKDVKKKISPYLVPYDQLDEETKDLDRDTIRNIPKLLGMIGMGIYVKRSSKRSE